MRRFSIVACVVVAIGMIWFIRQREEVADDNANYEKLLKLRTTTGLKLRNLHRDVNMVMLWYDALVIRDYLPRLFDEVVKSSDEIQRMLRAVKYKFRESYIGDYPFLEEQVQVWNRVDGLKNESLNKIRAFKYSLPPNLVNHVRPILNRHEYLCDRVLEDIKKYHRLELYMFGVNDSTTQPTPTGLRAYQIKR